MLRLIVRREFVTRVRSRLFLIATGLLLVLVAGYIAVQALVFNRAVTTVTVGFTGQAQALAQPLKASTAGLDVRVETRTVPDLQAGENEVRSGSLDVLVSGDPVEPTVVVKDQLNPTVAAALTGLVRQGALNRAVSARGVDPAAIEAQVAAAKIDLTALSPTAAQRTQRTVAGVVVAILLYVALLVYGQLVAQGVVEEKANRIVEILLSTVRPRQLLLGKVIGIGLVGVLQLVLVGGVALVVAARTQVVSVPTIGVTAVVGGLVWFVLGFVLYALVYAAGAALVSRQEDVAAVTMPITMLIVGSYLALFWVLASPDNPVAVALTMLPPLAPVLMPARMASGDAQAWQVLLAVVLTVSTIAGLNALAARIYANSVLRIGARVRLREAWRGRQA